MQLLCLSISHRRAPVELRECLSLPPEMIAEVYPRHPIQAGPFKELEEMAILSTCNRLEVYAMVSLPDAGLERSELAFRPLLLYLEEALGLPAARIEPYFQVYREDEVVEHLFQVAGGLDSIAIGETQILGQVSRALDEALRIGSARHVLSSLFRSAVHAGKRVQSETEIRRHPASISAVGVQLAHDLLGSLVGQKALVVGAGKMGGLTIEALKEHGVTEITLTNRTYEHARELAGPTGIAALPFANLADGLAGADLVFTSTSATLPIIRREQVAEAMHRRPERPLMLVDLAVPRNVDVAVRRIPNVRLFDMDDLQAHVKSAEGSIHPEIDLAKSIVAEEIADYEKLLKVIPTIGELHRKIELIRQREVERALKNLKKPDPLVSEQIELLSRALVRKILHEPTMHLRTESNQDTLNDYVDTLSRLFDLGTIEPHAVLE